MRDNLSLEILAEEIIERRRTKYDRFSHRSSMADKFNYIASYFFLIWPPPLSLLFNPPQKSAGGIPGE